MSFYTFLPKLLNMSLTASVAIVFVLLLRLLLRKAPKVISYALWGIVLFRLLCPVSFESSFSLFGLFDAPTAEIGKATSSMEYVPTDIVHTEYPSVVLPIPGVNDVINDSLPQGEEQMRVDPLEGPIFIGTYVWGAGVIVMAAYAVLSYIKICRKLITASPLRKNIYLADEITSPFVMGLIHPKIYLPSTMDEQEQSYILLHEQHHIRRLDHIFKALGFLALCIHWFNPLVWVAFILAGKDMEMSCDEAVVKKMGEDIRADYTASLLSLATGKRIIAGTPLAFGEGDTKGRIHNLANRKKPTIWIILVAVLACAILAVMLLTNPMQRQTTVLGANYDIGEIIISRNLADEDAMEAPLQYCVTADYHLYVKYEEDEGWVYLGKLEPYSLTKKELLSYIQGQELDGYRLSEITDSYILRVEDQNFYMVMQTKSGDTLLSYGWEDLSERWDGPSDDTSLRQIYLLESTFHEGYVNGSFFMRTLRTATGSNVYAFASFESDRIPGYHIEGFKCGDSEDHTEMTDMGFAVFQTNGIDYRLIDCKVYEGAVAAENGVYFCPDPAVADVNGEIRNDNSFDVILICNENVGKIERVYHAEGKDDYSIADSNISTHSMFLFSWDIGEEYESMSQYIYDKGGNLLTAEVSLPVNSASWEDLPQEVPEEAIEWFDYYQNDQMNWDGRQEITLDAFPDVTFRWYSEKVEAIVGEKITPLYTGMPIWNVFFSDLTGDGLPELCSTLSFGSGMIDERIIIYDYANRVSYSLEDRGKYDFSLSLHNGRIMVTKRDHSSHEIVDQGYLAYLNDTVTIVKASESSPIAFSANLAGNTSFQQKMILASSTPYWAIIVENEGDSAVVIEIGGNVFRIPGRNKEVIQAYRAWSPGSYEVSFSGAGASKMYGNVTCILMESLTDYSSGYFDSVSSVTELIPGIIYVPYQCIYMNMASSYYPFGGDSGCKYTIYNSSFSIDKRTSEGVINIADLPELEDTGKEYDGASISVPKWEWQAFPYSKKEWAELFLFSLEPMSNFLEQHNEILYQPINNNLFLLRVDGSIWLVELSEDGQGRSYIWSIYSLVPESAMGVAQWEFTPILSSRAPVFTFQFDMDYTHITAACGHGTLTEFNYGDKSGKELTIPAGMALYWAPPQEGISGTGVDTIRFTVHNGDTPTYHGTLYLEESERSNSTGKALYTARLVGTGLHLSQNQNTEGGIITLIGGSMPAPEEIEYDLGTGDLKIPASELGNYIFYTNTTKLKVKVEGEKDLVGTARILDATKNDVVCGTHEVSTSSKKVAFNNLISTSRYRVTWDGPEDCIITVSD